MKNLYRNVRELTDMELEQLKLDLFYRDKETDGLTEEEQQIIDNCEIWSDIPNELVYNIFDGITFVDEDFACNICD